MTLPLLERDSSHFVYGVIAVLMMLANANHPGIPFLGNHPKVSRHGKHVGIAFARSGHWCCTELVGIRECLADEIPSTLQTIVEVWNEQMRSSRGDRGRGQATRG
jgi:hypothetical protein